MRALKTQEPLALHDLPASGRGVVAHYDAFANSGGRAPDPLTDEGGGWYWVQLDEGVAAGAPSVDDEPACWGMTVDSDHENVGHYVSSFPDAVVQAAIEHGWRIRARVRLNAGDEPVSFRSSLMIDGMAVPSAPSLHEVTHDPESATGEEFLRGSFTDAVVFGIQREAGGPQSVDVQSFEFAILDPRGRLNTEQSSG